MPARPGPPRDASPTALELARDNAEQNGVRVTLFEGSLFEPFPGRRFDLIVSNPPYIPTADLETLQTEVREYEPRTALDGGPDGLEFYRLIVPAATEHLNPGGWLLFEVGIGQAVLVQATTAYGYDNSYVLDSAASHPDRFTAAGAVAPVSRPR